MNNLSLAAPISVMIFGLLIWAGAGWLCWQNWQRNPNRRIAARLESVRFFLITLLVFTLLRPEYIQHLQRKETPEIAVLADASGSMATRDAIVSNSVVSRGDWISMQRSNQFWRPLQRNAKVAVAVEDFSAPSTNQNSAVGTDINAALEAALSHHKNLKAVLLLSDGDWNLGKSPLGIATRFREQNIPVFTVGVGRETPVPDLVLENVSAPAYGLFGEQIAIPFKISSHLPREVKTTVAVFDQYGETTKKEITIPAKGELQEAILWSPREVGEVIASVKIPVETDEGITNNNERAFHISIRVDKLKVLVVDSLPRWEYRYLRNALARDPGVEMHCLLFHPGMGPGDGVNYIKEFPNTKEALSPYDVVFLGDVGVGENELTEKDVELLKGLVEQQSSGLVFIPGRRGRENTFLKSGLKDLFPVVLDEKKPEGLGLQNESYLMLSSVGKKHLLTRFDADENRNDELWKQLPGFFWSAAVEKSRPGSEVLAVHSELRSSWGRMPLLVTRAAGSGKVLFMGTDAAWRWRRGVEDKFHYRFWGQVVRWMAHQRHLSEKDGIRLSYSPETPQTGDTIFLQSVVLDATGFPIEQGPVVGKITSPRGRAERLEFSAMEGGWGVFKSSFVPQESGKFKIEISAPQHGRKLETELLVTQPVLEKLGQPINSQMLREISSITHGANFTTETFDKAIQQISVLPEPAPLEKRIRLWSEPFWGGIILLLLVVYWVGRKLAGLI